MKIIRTFRRDRLILELRGDFDHWSSPEVQESVEAELADGHVDLDLDLGQVGFLSSEGAGTLLMIWRLLGRRGGSLRLIRMSAVVRWTLTSLGVEQLLDVDHQAA